MGRLIEFLLNNPLIALLVIGWLLSAVGQAVAKGRRAAAGAPRQGGAPPRPARAPQQRSPEEIAAEMRRILGMDPRPAPPAPARPPAPAARPPAPRLQHADEPRLGDAPVAVGSRPIGDLAVKVDPHVGETIRQRRAPATGSVGAVALGDLGGRQRTGRVIERRGSSLVDLQDLPRAIVLREILDRPLALRD
jgi:hypothetical protein